MFTRGPMLQRLLNLGKKAFGKQRNLTTNFNNTRPIPPKWMFDDIKRLYEDKIKLLEAATKAAIEDKRVAIEDKRVAIEEDKRVAIEDKRVAIEDKKRAVEAAIEDKRVAIEDKEKYYVTEIAVSFPCLHLHWKLSNEANIGAVEQGLHEEILRANGKFHSRGALEYVASKILAKGSHEGVQPKLDRIAQGHSFKKTFRNLCTEFVISEGQAEESRKEIYHWSCKYVHTGADNLTIITDGKDNPTSIAVALMTYLRVGKIRHSYRIGSQTLKWPSP